MPKNQDLHKETIRFRESPLGFKLSAIKVEARKKNPGKKPIAHPCSFCGSVKLLGDANARAFSKSGRAFCDEDCASEWKSIHYASANHKPFEESRQRTRAKRAIEAESARKKAEERELARLLKPANQKTSGYYTCEVCKKTEWVASHSMKKFCSDKCRGKSTKAIATKKRAKRNRRHRIRAGSTIGEVVCLYKLMQKHRNRCKQCNTLCVQPEGYNHSNEGTIDHIMPLSKGGLHLWNNVQLLCRQCNSAKRDIVLPGTQMMLRFDR